MIHCGVAQFIFTLACLVGYATSDQITNAPKSEGQHYKPEPNSGGRVRYHRLPDFQDRVGAAKKIQQRIKHDHKVRSSATNDDYFDSYLTERNRKMSDATLDMIKFAFENYKEYAFPYSDEVKPHSCAGKNNSLLGSGTFAATLVDSLDTLAITGMQKEFWDAVSFICHNLSRKVFGADYRDFDDGPQTNGEKGSCGWAPFSSSATSSISVEHLSPPRRCPVQTQSNSDEPFITSSQSSPVGQSNEPFSAASPCGCPYSDPLRSTPKVNPHLSGFETNIRLIGGLLSGHFMIEEGIVSPVATVVEDEQQNGLKSNEDMGAGASLGDTSEDQSKRKSSTIKVYNYDGCLLRLAIAIGRQLLPLFSTPTGIPYGSFYFRDGVRRGEIEQTSVADGGTYLLEFTILSRVSGDPRFEAVAKRATRAIYKRRHPLTNLLGSHINVTSGAWTVLHASIGSGTDSYLEYLVKQFILTGEKEFYLMFDVLHQGIYTYLRIGSSESYRLNQKDVPKPKSGEFGHKVTHLLSAITHNDPTLLTQIQDFPTALYQTNSMTGTEAYFGPGSDGSAKYIIQSYTDANGKPATPTEDTINLLGLRHIKAHTGSGTHGSLCNFYPGLLALAGHLDEAKVAIASQQIVWDTIGAFPESVHVSSLSSSTASAQAEKRTASFWQKVDKNAQKRQRSSTTDSESTKSKKDVPTTATARITSGEEYPLRPEHIESLYVMYETTKDDAYIEMARRVIIALEARTRARCGYGTLRDATVLSAPTAFQARVVDDAFSNNDDNIIGYQSGKNTAADMRVPPLADTVFPKSLREAYFGDSVEEKNHNRDYHPITDPDMLFAANVIDEQESFAISETLKYGYLIFSQKEREKRNLEWAKGLNAKAKSDKAGEPLSEMSAELQWAARPFLQRGHHSTLSAFNRWQKEAIRECSAIVEGRKSDPLADSSTDAVVGALCSSVFARRHSLLWVFNTEGHPFPVRPEWSPALSASPRASAVLYRHWTRCCPQQALWRQEDGSVEGGVQRIAARRGFGSGSGSSTDLSLADLDKDKSMVPYGQNDFYYGCVGDTRPLDPTRPICGQPPVVPPPIEDTNSLTPVDKSLGDELEEVEPLHPLTEPLQTFMYQKIRTPVSHWRGHDKLSNVWKSWADVAKGGSPPPDVLLPYEPMVYNATRMRILDKFYAMYKSKNGNITEEDRVEPFILRTDTDETVLNCPSPHGPIPYYWMGPKGMDGQRWPVSEGDTVRSKKEPSTGKKKETKKAEAVAKEVGAIDYYPTSQLENIFADDDSFFESQLSSEFWRVQTPLSYERFRG